MPYDPLLSSLQSQAADEQAAVDDERATRLLVTGRERKTRRVYSDVQVAAARAFTIMQEADDISRVQILKTLQKLPEFASLGRKTHDRWMKERVKQRSGPKVNAKFEEAVTSFLVLKVSSSTTTTTITIMITTTHNTIMC